MIIAGIFILIAIATIIYFNVSSKFGNHKFKNYLLASSYIWLSGLVLVFILLLTIKEIEWIFALISCVSISAVYCFTVFMILKLTKSIEALNNAENDNNEKE